MYMQPQTTKEPFTLLEYQWGDEVWAPSSDAPWHESMTLIREVPDKWFVRLSAPGTLDCTDWQGPYNSEGAAIYALWDLHGTMHESFYDFIGEDKYIVEGTLTLAGRRNELYGQPAEDLSENAQIWLATLSDIDIDEETGESFEYAPNDDPDLAEAYGFELVSKKRALELHKRFEVYKRAYDQETEA
jgi:hypothetical protein